MADPATLEEFNALQNARLRIEGYFDQVTIYAPCPFCCAPDVMTYKMLDVDAAMQKRYTCGECARGFTFLVDRDPQQIRFEMVQTQGPPPPPYFPGIRRVEETPQ